MAKKIQKADDIEDYLINRLAIIGMHIERALKGKPLEFHLKRALSKIKECEEYIHNLTKEDL